MSEDLADQQILRIEQQVAEAQQRAEAALRMREQIEQIHGVARSRDSEITATVDPSGRLQNIEFTDEALEYSPRDLAELVLEIVGEAQADAGRQVMGLVKETFGDDPELNAQLQQAYVTENPHKKDDGYRR